MICVCGGRGLLWCGHIENSRSRNLFEMTNEVQLFIYYERNERASVHKRRVYLPGAKVESQLENFISSCTSEVHYSLNIFFVSMFMEEINFN